MPLNAALIDHLQNHLSKAKGGKIIIKNYTPVSGGSINRACCLTTAEDQYMLKLNSRSAYPNMFEREAKGLKTIAETKTIAVPAVILQNEIEDESFLLMEWIPSKRATGEASEQLGRQLAMMHKYPAPEFGFTTDNYMGSLPQSNRKHSTWTKFFVEERLQPLVQKAFDSQLLNQHDLKQFETLYNKLSALYPEEKPALIHGDLWGGNYLIREDNRPYLIDPAVSYGHREFDLAMTTLFGGFSRTFYEAYHETFPLDKNWQQRINLWNLYPLLVHLILFGTGYLGQVRDALREYV